MNLKRKWKLNKIRKQILSYYRQIDVIDPEIKTALKFLKRQNFFTITSASLIFPSDFSLKYKNFSFDVNFDDELKMHYVYHKGKKLFFLNSLSLNLFKNFNLGICLSWEEAPS